MATLTASTLSIPYNFTSGTAADASQVNSDFTATQTQVNNLVTDTQTLNTATGQLSANNTWTGTNTYQANITAYNLYFTATYGLGDNFILMDAARAAAERDQSIRFSRGTTSATPARITYDATNHLYRFSTDADSTLSIIRIADGAASTDGMTYGQGMKATGSVAETVTGVKTYSSYPLAGTSYVAPTTDLQFIPKKYADDQYASVSTGGILQQSSTPAVTANTLWIDTTTVANLKFLRANGTVYAPITGIHQGSSAPTSPAPLNGHLWIDTTSTASSSLKRYDGSNWKQVLPATVDAATTFTASPTFSTGFAVTAGQTIDFNSNILTEVGTPVATTDAANKTYVDTSSPKIFACTANFNVTCNTSPVSLLGTGVGSLTLAANKMIAGSCIRITGKGVMSTDGTPNTLLLTVKLGSVTITATGATTPPASFSGAAFEYRALLTCQTTGASGSVQGTQCLEVGTGTGAPITMILGSGGSPATVDTTASQAITATITGGAGNAATMAFGTVLVEFYT